MARVDDEDARGDEVRPREVALHELGPAELFRVRHLRVPVAGQVGEVDLIVDKEIVYMRRLAGGRARAGEVLAVQQAVYDGRLADVRPAGEDYLSAPVVYEVLLRGCGADEFDVVVVHSIIL